MYRHWVAFASALLMTTTIAGGLRAAPASAAPSPTKAGAHITITGEAIDIRPTGTPLVLANAPRIADARVHFSPANVTRFTDKHGRFSVDLRTASPQTVTISKTGFATWTLEDLSPNDATGGIRALMFASASHPKKRSAPIARAAVSGFHPSCSGWTSGLLPPPVIYVLVYASHKKNPIGNLIDDPSSTNSSVAVNFNDYVKTVLPDEWSADSPIEAFKAGAVAVKMFAWHDMFTVGPHFDDDGNCADIFDDTRSQVYAANPVYNNPPTSTTNAAVDATWDVVASNQGLVAQTQYYNNGSTACAPTADYHHMTQLGSETCARNGDDYSLILTVFYPLFSFFSNAAPYVMDMSPEYGTTKGGTQVTITGQGFFGATVYVGGVPAQIVAEPGDNSLTFVTPPQASAHTSGVRAATATVSSVPIVVKNAQGTVTVGKFTYTDDQSLWGRGGQSGPTGPPVVATMNPTIGPDSSGTSIHIEGAGFMGTTAVNFDGVPANFTVIDDSTLRTTAPHPHADGAVTVTVVTPLGTTTAGQFTYKPGTQITDIEPWPIPSRGIGVVDVYGVSMGDPEVGSTTVYLDGNRIDRSDLHTASPDDGTHFIISPFPAHAPGLAFLTVHSPTLGTFTGVAKIIGPPTVTEVSPGLVPTSGGITLTIQGTNFVNVGNVLVGGQFADFTVVSPKKIVATLPAMTCTKLPCKATVVVKAQGVASAVSKNSTIYYNTSASIAGVSPSSGGVTGGQWVHVTGTGFLSTPGVYFGEVPAVSYRVAVDGKSLDAQVPPGVAGTVDIHVVDATFGNRTPGVPADQFTYQQAAVNGVSPNTLWTGTTNVTITGTHFSDATEVDFGTVPATFTRVSDSVIKATVPFGVAIDGTSAYVVVKSTQYGPSTPNANDVVMFAAPAWARTPAVVIGRAFMDLSGAYPNDDDLTTWTTKFAGGNATPSTLAQYLLNKPDWLQPIYNQILGRNATPIELFSLPKTNGRYDAQALRVQLLGSDEFWNAHGATKASWLAALGPLTLGRPFTAAETAFFAAALTPSTNRVTYVAGMLATDAFRNYRIDQIYEWYLARPASTAERTWMLNVLKSGALEEDIATALLTSDEYTQRASTGYVNSEYLRVMARAATPAELAQWSHDFAMGTATPTDMTQTMVGAAEMPSALVTRFWAEFLRGSAPTAAEKANIVSILQSGTADRFMRARAAVLASPEALAQFSSPLSSLPENDWVAGMVWAVDHRTPSSAEQEALYEQIATIGRAGVALSVLQTDEARAQIVQWLYMAQQRNPTDAETAAGVAQLDAGASELDMTATIGADPRAQARGYLCDYPTGCR